MADGCARTGRSGVGAAGQPDKKDSEDGQPGVAAISIDPPRRRGGQRVVGIILAALSALANFALIRASRR
jgi:hypothetical protein